ncbi:MAG: NAD(P)/FAD-dependent oxidoreductase [Chloroflexi bacterium]|nr:NAD(P)/FAD-dependent oxidoreductase [Chloroflexota bacterium]
MSVVSDIEKSQQPVSVAQYDVVVVGAGPYGLSAAAHLRGRGLKVAIFGKTLELWRYRMPPGMCLRSHWWATDLSDPKKQYSFNRFYKQSAKYQPGYPVPIETFIDYALWFQKNVVPDVDETYVSSIERKDKQFVLTLVDGRVVQSSAVVMAIGLYYYANRPEEYSHLPAELVSHSFDHGAFDHFAGKQIVVIGAGQSAVENSALLNEAGANVHLVARRPIHWLDPDRTEGRPLLEQLRAPTAGIAIGWVNWGLEHLPYLFHRLPQYRKDRYIRSHYTAAANDWLRDRVIGKVTLHEGQKITKMEQVDNHVEVTLSNGEKLQADHVMCATGYKVNIKNLSMLHPSLLAEIETMDGGDKDENTPILNSWFESSVPGLYFLGLTTLRSFGPLYRFVVGAKAAASRVASSAPRRVRRLARAR